MLKRDVLCNVTLHSTSRFNIGLSGLHCSLNLLSHCQAQQICMTFLFQLVGIAKVSLPRRYWYRDIWYRDISWYRQYRPTLHSLVFTIYISA